jgi:hypothetical protein
MILDRRSIPAFLAAAFAVTLLASFPAGAKGPFARGQEKKITLDWVYKKKDLGIDDPREVLPQELAWSPKGHLLRSFRRRAPTAESSSSSIPIDPACATS